MIAGSTGIAPLIQVIHEAMFSAVDYTEIKVCVSTSHNFVLSQTSEIWRVPSFHALVNSVQYIPSKIFQSYSRRTCMHQLILCSETTNDILLRDELDALQRLYPDRLTVYHVVEKPPVGWGMGTHLDEATITEIMPSALEAREGEAVIMVSGPDDLLNDVAGQVSTRIGAAQLGHAMVVPPLVSPYRDANTLYVIWLNLTYSNCHFRPVFSRR